MHHEWQLQKAYKAITQICKVLAEADTDQEKVKTLKKALKSACDKGINAVCLANAHEEKSLEDLSAVKDFLTQEFEDLVENDKAPW